MDGVGIILIISLVVGQTTIGYCVWLLFRKCQRYRRTEEQLITIEEPPEYKKLEITFEEQLITIEEPPEEYKKLEITFED